MIYAVNLKLKPSAVEVSFYLRKSPRCYLLLKTLIGFSVSQTHARTHALFPNPSRSCGTRSNARSSSRRIRRSQTSNGNSNARHDRLKRQKRDRTTKNEKQEKEKKKKKKKRKKSKGQICRGDLFPPPPPPTHIELQKSVIEYFNFSFFHLDNLLVARSVHCT